jgi:glycogen(starch) synthase
MRILHVINNATTCGGAERLTADLARRQRQAGHQTHVLAGDRDGEGERFADSTWPVLIARGPARIRNFYWNRGARAALKALVTRWHPDVVHLHTIGLLSVAALPALRGVPTVMTVHGPELFLHDTVRFCLPARCFRGGDRIHGRLNLRGVAAYTWAGVVTAGLTRCLLRRYVDIFTAPSPYMAARVERSLGTARVVRNGLDENYLAAATTRRYDHASRTPRLVVVARLDETKGVQVLLAAMPTILAAHPRAHLTIVGTGEMEERLRRLAADLGVESAVTLVGWQPPAGLAATLARADVAVIPSIWPESFGMAALEALATGCAVVASDCGGLPDLVRHNETGVLVPPGDVGVLADAVRRLLDDPALCRRLATAGFRLASQLTLSAHATGVLNLYREAIDRQREQPVIAPSTSEVGSPCR